MINIETLKNEKRKLEYELVEKQFQYESIPKRKQGSTLKVWSHFIVAVPVTIFVVACVITMIEVLGDMAHVNRSSINVGFSLLICPMGALFGGFVAFRLWRSWLEEMRLFYGMSGNKGNFGANNYRDEEKTVKANIKSLTESIADLNKAIADAKIANVQDALSSSESMTKSEDDRFFEYAYGRWGDGRNEIERNLLTDKYEKEEESIINNLQEQKRHLSVIAHNRVQIDSQYASLKNTILYYLLILLFIFFIQVVSYQDPKVAHVVQIVGLVYGMLGLLFLVVKYRDDFMNYKVEHKYQKYQTYAEDHNLLTTAMQKKKVMDKIGDLNNRLEYVQSLIEYKNKHSEALM